jgi:hypothetical protein
MSRRTGGGTGAEASTASLDLRMRTDHFPSPLISTRSQLKPMWLHLGKPGPPLNFRKILLGAARGRRQGVVGGACASDVAMHNNYNATEPCSGISRLI